MQVSCHDASMLCILQQWVNGHNLRYSQVQLDDSKVGTVLYIKTNSSPKLTYASFTMFLVTANLRSAPQCFPCI